MPDDVAVHVEHGHIAAIFKNREDAQGAISDLQELGVAGDHLGIALHGDESIVFERDAESHLAQSARTGAITGAPIGALAGMGLAALAVPGIGLIGVGGMFAFAGASALWGGLIGAYLGTAKGAEGWTIHEDLDYTALESGEVLMVVCSRDRGDEIRDAMERHHGRHHEIEATPT